MEFTFTKNVPASTGRSYLDQAHAQDVIDACLSNPGQWARVPYTYLYPATEGTERKKLATRSRSAAGRIQRGKMFPFNEYDTEAKARGEDIYIRINMTARERRQLDDF